MPPPLPYAATRRTPFPLHRLRLIVLLIILLAVLAARYISSLASRPHRSSGIPIDPGRASISNLKTGIDAFQADTGRCPSTTEGLTVLRSSPTATAAWHGPYLEPADTTDPWGHPLRYRYPGIHNPAGYDLQSAGPDGIPNTPDDRTNWR